MGKIILCSGIQTLKPYWFELTNTRVYSIEELCFYLYNNIYAINEEILMEKLAEKLLVLLEHRNSLKDIIVTILCSADYYTEDEIKDLIVIMDEIEHLTPVKRKKIKADNYLNYKMYAKAVSEYESILNDKAAATLTPEEYGNILHNLAITHLHITSYQEAANKFKEAYNLNHNVATLQQYLCALLLAENEEKYQEEIVYYQGTMETEIKIKLLLDEKMSMAQTLPDFEVVQKLPDIKSAGRVNEYYSKINRFLHNWKTEYRREIEG